MPAKPVYSWRSAAVGETPSRALGLLRRDRGKNLLVKQCSHLRLSWLGVALAWRLGGGELSPETGLWDLCMRGELPCAGPAMGIEVPPGESCGRPLATTGVAATETPPCVARLTEVRVVRRGHGRVIIVRLPDHAPFPSSPLDDPGGRRAAQCRRSHGGHMRPGLADPDGHSVRTCGQAITMPGCVRTAGGRAAWRPSDSSSVLEGESHAPARDPHDCRAAGGPVSDGATARPGAWAGGDGTQKKGYRRLINYPRAGRRGWRAFVPSWRLVTGTATGAFLLLVGSVAAVYALVKVPDLRSLRLPTATVYEYSDGSVFYTAGLQNRVIVPLSQVPPVVRQAIVSVENPTFYTDAGISPRGIIRSLVNDVEGGPLEGGSTITQQFVKNAYLTDDQTLTRKLTELFIAVKITRAYPKKQILADYLNTVYFGRESYGIDAAAETYFGVPASRVTDPGRAAYLAALVNEPTVLSRTDPADQVLLRQRWNLVLNDMVKTGSLSAGRRATVRWPGVLAPGHGIVRDASGVSDTAMEQAVNGYLDELHAKDPAVPDSAAADAGGDVIVTTFSHPDMTAATRAVSQGLYSRLNPRDPAQAAVDHGAQAGLASVDARNGELLAFYPGRSDYNNATQAQIEPGSQMQAFALAAHFPAPAWGRPAPVLGGRTAPADSLWALMSRVGLTQNLQANPAELPEPLTKLEHDPQLALGIAPESPARMADAFAAFADDGVYHDLAMALSVTAHGHKVWTYTPHGTRALAAPVAGLAPGLLAKPNSSAGKPAATGGFGCVPGTIGGDRSAWYSCYLSDVVTSVGVWDESVNTKHRVIQRSLSGLGRVPAEQSVTWPTVIWDIYTKMAASARPPYSSPPGAAR
jgi:membrane peptidoglycan carboxypeptidase